MPVSLGYAVASAESEKAVKFDTEEHGTLWVPKSCIHDDSEALDLQNDAGQLVVRSWWARERRLM